ncbi:sodium-dependent nutrient amino acid transporter 1-like isoform X2 [Ornithodoros turicata]
MELVAAGKNGICNGVPKEVPTQNGTCLPNDASLPKQEGRKQWSQGTQFFLSCLSMSIGLGNVWRFPTLAYQNGGGAFLVPYFIVLFIVGKPVYFLELAIGQFVGKSLVKIWNCVPGLRGIGVAQVLSTFYLTISYNYIMALCLFYMFASMQSALPWTSCNPEWSTANCLDNTVNNSFASNYTSAAEEYFQRNVLKDSGGFSNLSAMDWRMALCFLLTWTIMAMSTFKGIRSVGKVVYLTSSFPYLVMISLLIITCTQDGAWTGIKAFFVPDWEKIFHIEVWFRACEQSFFSLSTAFGHLIMYASYNDFRHQVGRDAFFISIADTCTSILAGCVVFASLGTLAHELRVEDVSQVLKGESDLGLAFVTYPEALSRISFVPQLWSVLFFLMLYLLGLGSSVGDVELIMTVLNDQYPSLKRWRSYLSVLTCVICFGTGLILCTDSGNYLRLLFDNYGVGQAVFLYAILEIVGLMWIYGWKAICKDFEYMLGSKISWFWKATWGFVTPVVLIAIFVYGNIGLEESGESKLPPLGHAIGWLLAAVAIGQVPLWMIVTYIRAPGKTLASKLKSTFTPNDQFGPRDLRIRKDWKEWVAAGRPDLLKKDQEISSGVDNQCFSTEANI